jgi:hypothetical protein
LRGKCTPNGQQSGVRTPWTAILVIGMRTQRSGYPALSEEREWDGDLLFGVEVGNLLRLKWNNLSSGFAKIFARAGLNKIISDWAASR